MATGLYFIGKANILRPVLVITAWQHQS